MTPDRRYRLGVMLGDGIGPEIVPASVRVVDAALAAAGGEPVTWQELPLGASAIGEPGTGEFMPTADVAICHGVFTRPAVERIARTAFELARRRRSRLTIVHKANVLQLGSGLFERVCLEVAG